MAEGFLHSSDGGNRNSLEDIANNYFRILVSNSFFQDVEKDMLGDIKTFKMHDLVHNLAQSVVDSHQVTILSGSEIEYNVSSTRRLHISLEEEAKQDKSKNIFNVFNDSKKLRTVICQNAHLYPSPVNKHLRVIYSLSGTPSRKESSSDFKFIHLRYLDLKSCKITNVQADSISQLYHLQTLSLKGCSDLENILKGIGHLKNLLHLDISHSSVQLLPDSILSLTNLQTLDISHCKGIRVLPINIGSLQNLVSLGFSNTFIKALPDSFGALTKLRSLDLGGTDIQELPVSLTSNICKLEFVNFGDVCMFPKDIRNWVELRSLIYFRRFKVCAIDSDEYQIMPRGIEWLTRLEVLVSYMVRNKKDYIGETNDSSGIEELAGLNSLRELMITYLDNVRGKKDAERAKLEDKQHIQRLYLKWLHKEEDEVEEEDADNSSMVLEGLKPNPNLELLAIQDFSGVQLPKWMGSSYCLPNLVKLFFEDCNCCEKLPALGMLPCLEVLQIVGMQSLKCLGEEFYYQQQQEGESSITTFFPSLVQLRINRMKDLEEWVAPPPPFHHAFPVLEDLSIERCKKLKSVPDLRLHTSLHKLKILKCNKLTELIPYDLKNNLAFVKELSLDDDLTMDDFFNRMLDRQEDLLSGDVDINQMLRDFAELMLDGLEDLFNE